MESTPVARLWLQLQKSSNDLTEKLFQSTYAE